MLYMPQKEEVEGMSTFETYIYLDERNKENPDNLRILDILTDREERKKENQAIKEEANS